MDELKRKKRAFSTRASRAKAIELAQLGELDSGGELEDIFERWGIKITESEICSNVSTDALEDNFTIEEESSDLEQELDRLCSEARKTK